MGREPVDIHMDNKSNGVILTSNGSSNGDIVHAATPGIVDGNLEADEVKECTEQCPVVENTRDKQEVLGVKGTNFDGKNAKPGSQKSADAKKLKTPSSKSRGNGNTTVPKPFALATEKRASLMTRPVGIETTNSSGSNATSSNSPTASKGSQSNSPLTARKSDYKKHLDEEDSWSVASSFASIRTVKSKVTVGVAPTFKSMERVERRKEYYQKLEEKHQALEAEKRENEQRLKEEQEAAIRRMRRNMAYRANPVPNFYYEGPPPKAELKKLPLTRPKSPNLNRRKSCNDAINSEEKGKHCVRHRHSIDLCKEECKGTNSPRSKGQMSSPRTPKTTKDLMRNANGRPKSVKSAPGKMAAKETTKRTQEKDREQNSVPASDNNPEDNAVNGVSGKTPEEATDADVSYVVST